jgi:UDP-glucose 4-epimerase
MSLERVLVTGGAGFIGSHLVDRLIEGNEVVVLDDLSGGSMGNLVSHKANKHFKFIRGSITSEADVKKSLEGVTTVYHLAAQPDVRLSAESPIWDFKTNVVGSMVLLDALRTRDVKRLVFASSGGTVYGQTDIFPTPESTAFRPISNYGAAKAAFEMYLSSFAELYGINSVSMRYGNVIGPRLTHGVIFDFYIKLKHDPRRLEVLGDGKQEKAYLYVSDAVEAAMVLSDRMKDGFLPVNVSSGERLSVSRIAEIVRDQLGIRTARIEYTGSERGWPGDVRTTDIDISVLKSFGWKPKVRIEEGVRLCVKWLAENSMSTK